MKVINRLAAIIMLPILIGCPGSEVKTSAEYTCEEFYNWAKNEYGLDVISINMYLIRNIYDDVLVDDAISSMDKGLFTIGGLETNSPFYIVALKQGCQYSMLEPESFEHLILLLRDEEMYIPSRVDNVRSAFLIYKMRLPVEMPSDLLNPLLDSLNHNDN